MSQHTTIALDAMGGDDAPAVVIRGANIARERHPNVHFLLFGKEGEIQELLKPYPKLAENCTIHHTDEMIAADLRPSQALRQSKRSSMRLAIEAVKEGKAQSVVSAGNTGALMALAKIILGTMPGITRPAIGSFFPTERGESVMLDMGANVDCDAENLVQWAVLGEVFARTALGVSKPSVGLLNVGSEEQKGKEFIRQAAAQLRELSLPMDFQGFIEGDDIPAGTVDVIVCDGFTGNVALKTAEGTARLYANSLKRTMKSSLLARLGYLFARGGFARLRAKLDPRQYNGAVFLGLNGIVVKSHGGTDALGFANAVGVAVDMLEHGFLHTVSHEFESISHHLVDDPSLIEAI